jgi:4'-phosphopantetheinyl transferase
LSELIELTDGQVHLWYSRTENAKPQHWVGHCEGLLSPSERARHQRFVFQRDRDQFLIARVLLRTTLSRYSSLQPGDWRFQVNEFGKPEIDSSQTPSPLRFNLSHCDGLVICGVTVGRKIGVDCENTQRHVEISNLAPRVFSACEQECLESAPASARAETFFRFWTLKEAYIKARGLGMQIPLPEFSMDFANSDSIGISFSRKIEDQSRAWQFFEPALPAPFLAAVAVNLPPEKRLTVETFSVQD